MCDTYVALRSITWGDHVMKARPYVTKAQLCVTIFAMAVFKYISCTDLAHEKITPKFSRKINQSYRQDQGYSWGVCFRGIFA